MTDLVADIQAIHPETIRSSPLTAENQARPMMLKLASKMRVSALDMPAGRRFVDSKPEQWSELAAKVLDEIAGLKATT